MPVDGFYSADDEPIGDHSDDGEHRGDQERRRKASGSIDHDSGDHRRGNSCEISYKVLHPEPSGRRSRSRERLRAREECGV